jgi:hypothetical protein
MNGSFSTSCGEPWPAFPTAGEHDRAATATAGDGSGEGSPRLVGPRPRVHGKFLYAGDDRLLVRA